jgi:hypothetical protein
VVEGFGGEEGFNAVLDVVVAVGPGDAADVGGAAGGDGWGSSCLRAMSLTARRPLGLRLWECVAG